MCMHIDSTRKDILPLCIKYRIALHCSKGPWRTNCDNLLTLNENITLKIIVRCNDTAVSNNCTHKQAPSTNQDLRHWIHLQITIYCISLLYTISRNKKSNQS